MSSFHHRDSGLPGATFESGRIFASIIADGIHVAYNTLSISKKIMKERLYLVSDAVEENKHGAYLHVRQKDRFTLPDGTLSGSKLTMIEAVRNCVEHAGIHLDEALRMASTYPAQVIKAKDKGEIVPGYKADLIIFNKDFELKNITTFP
jgi:N-acetylglucosamine-6-phosphate deacetylase